MRKMPMFYATAFLILAILTSMPASAAAPLIFPHFVQGGGFQTTFTFNNLSTVPGQILMTFYSQSGGLIGSASVSMPSFGSATYALTTAAMTVGWARAQFTGMGDVAGMETIQLVDAGGSVLMETSVFAAQPDTVLRTPVYERDGFKTGLALVNPGTEESNLTLVLRHGDGSTMGIRDLLLEPSQQTARFVSELFPSLNDFEGTIEISGAQPVAGLALRYNEEAGVFSSAPVSPQSPEPYFSPRGGISSLIVKQIQNAQNTIDVEIYEFTRAEIMNALIAAKNRGVSIRILADSSEAALSGSAIPKLEAAGIPVKRTAGSGGGIMHNKIAIFDRQVLLTGSYNWSTAAEESNDENALFLRTPSVIATYQTTFDNLWLTR